MEKEKIKSILKYLYELGILEKMLYLRKNKIFTEIKRYRNRKRFKPWCVKSRTF